MNILPKATLGGTLVALTIALGGHVVAGDRVEDQKDRIDDRAKAEKERVEDRARVQKDRIDDKAKRDKDAVDGRKGDTTVGEDITDAWITTKIKGSYVNDKVLKGSDITVDTEDKGVVILSGTVPSVAARDHAVAVARQTKGVRTVQDRLRITR